MPRWVELAVTLVLLVLLAPLLLVTAVLVLVSSGRPVLFWQERVGLRGRPFRLCKFRTMASAAGGGPLTLGRDTRVTAVGRWLRPRRLDELPQLWNVLRGDMGLVGTRPEVVGLLCYDAGLEQELQQSRPGLTDPASLAYRDEALLLSRQADPERYYREVLRPAKARMSVDYQSRRTTRSDAVVLWRTAACLLGRTRSGGGPDVGRAAARERAR